MVSPVSVVIQIPHPNSSAVSLIKCNLNVCPWGVGPDSYSLTYPSHHNCCNCCNSSFVFSFPHQSSPDYPSSHPSISVEETSTSTSNSPISTYVVSEISIDFLVCRYQNSFHRVDHHHNHPRSREGDFVVSAVTEDHLSNLVKLLDRYWRLCERWVVQGRICDGGGRWKR